jgi:hypothetical protein
VFVECAPTEEYRAKFPYGTEVVIADHHREGDVGFGRSPAAFLPASAIGQVLTLLREPGEALECHITLQFIYGKWYRCGARWGAQEVSPDIVLTAAADHCLGAAYAGECPGVNPTALQEFRTVQRAALRNCTEDSVRKDMDRAVQALIAVPEIELVRNVSVADMRSVRHQRTTSEAGDVWEWVSFTNEPVGSHTDDNGTTVVSDVIPELPEAACSSGTPFLTQISDRDGRRKVVIQAAKPTHVKAFFVWAKNNGLTDAYGDPARGFAGAYLP